VAESFAQSLHPVDGAGEHEGVGDVEAREVRRGMWADSTHDSSVMVCDEIYRLANAVVLERHGAGDGAEEEDRASPECHMCREQRTWGER
jgi:hypothetical protein